MSSESAGLCNTTFAFDEDHLKSNRKSKEQ